MKRQFFFGFFALTLMSFFIKNWLITQNKNRKIPINMQNQNSTIDLKDAVYLKVKKYVLPNGMTVLLHQDNRIPYIYHQLLVKVGSRHEEKGKTGLAHLFEHMMFRGTAKYTGEEYEHKLESIGASNNAFTSKDYTAYDVTLPKEHLEMILEMESERLNSLKLTQHTFDTEREVVKEERRQTTDNNPNQIFEPLMDLIFKTHFYGRPLIGFMSDLNKMTLDDCKEFYKSYYSPNNSILILAGNFELKKTQKLIQKYYGVLQSSQIKKSVFYQEPIQTKQRFIQIKRAVHAPTLVFAYRGPKAGAAGSYSMEVLSRVLTSGESSRLHQLLVYKHKLALSVGGFYYGLKEEGVLIIYIGMVPGGDLQKTKKIIIDEMQRVHSEEISQKEILKNKMAIMYDYISDIKSLSGKANALSGAEAYFGDYQEFFKDLNKYQQVSKQSIKKQINLYIDSQKLSILELLPKK